MQLVTVTCVHAEKLVSEAGEEESSSSESETEKPSHQEEGSTWSIAEISFI